jgi:hypothetical protein
VKLGDLVEALMKMKFAVAAVLAALVGPASAATVLDFTTKEIGTGNTTGTALPGIGYKITGSSKLTNATHKTDLGCDGSGWNFDCNKLGKKSFDVGFGVDAYGVSDNTNEIDGMIKKSEWVQVTFDSLVKIVGFAGMLAYNDSKATGGTETVVLQYSTDGFKTFKSLTANAIDDDNNPWNNGDNQFNTAGLAFLDGLKNIKATAVRFTAGGVKPFDDGNANITAAGLKVAPVPVPASFPLLLAGIGALGFAARRKRKAA